MSGLTVIACLLAVGALLALGKRRDWSFATAVTDRWDRARPWLTASIRTAPVTFIYLFAICVTTWVLVSSNPALDRRLLLSHSTDLRQLGRHPLDVLLSSAFYLDSPWLIIVWLVSFPLVVAPTERWLGSIRLVVVFLAGHIVATLLTAALIARLVARGYLTQLANVIDVGTSYGFAAIVGVFTYRLNRPWNWGWALGWLAAAMLAMRVHRSFTNFGHLVALLVGFALAPITRAPGAVRRCREPLIAPPEWAVEHERLRIDRPGRP